MAEFTNTAEQTVDADENVVYNAVPVRGCRRCIGHREGSGIVKLRGCGSRCKTFRVSFGANIAIPADGTVEPISLALSVGGEALEDTEVIVTPAAVEEFSHVYASTLIHVWGCDSEDVAVVNTSDQPITVLNPKLSVERKG